MNGGDFGGNGPGSRGPLGLFVGVMVAVVIGAGATIPILVDAIAGSGASGTTATVMGLVPLFVAVLLLVALARPLLKYTR